MEATQQRDETLAGTSPDDTTRQRLVSLEDAARVLGIRRETLKRWNADGAFTSDEFQQLPAIRGRGHAWAVDLDAAKREHARRWTPPRVRADAPLAVTFLPANNPSHRVVSLPPRDRARSATRPMHSTSELPAELIPWREFAILHGIHVSTVKDAIERGKLRVVRGNWKVGRGYVKGALDAEGRHQFYRLWCHRPDFVTCSECPHVISDAVPPNG